MTVLRHRPATRALAVLLAACFALGLAACGSSNSSSTAVAGTGTAGTGNRLQARVNLAKCLRAHGVNVPDPTSGGGPGGGGGGVFRSLRDIPPTQQQSLRQACASQFTAAFPQLNLSPAQRAQFQQQLVKFAQCMRSHGVNIPDPTTTTTGTGGFGFGRAFRSVDRNSPAFRSAATACASVRPRFGRGGGGPVAGGGPGA
ncbi:MAG: hypothetical protein M3Z27_04500 [Actinomycetota bacterium]|nr:hypothetical protein [Actinomycetota bacterium]